MRPGFSDRKVLQESSIYLTEKQIQACNLVLVQQTMNMVSHKLRVKGSRSCLCVKLIKCFFYNLRDYQFMSPKTYCSVLNEIESKQDSLKEDKTFVLL